MRTQLTKITLTAGIALAIAFTLNACSSSDDDNGGIHDDGSLSSLPEYQEMQERYKYYDPADAEERCKNGVVERRCEVDGKEVWYNPLKQNCDRDIYYYLSTFERCGNEIILINYLENQRCNGGVVEKKCGRADGDKWGNQNTHYCDSDYDPVTMTDTYEIKAKELCGNVYYIPGNKEGVCKNGVLGSMCGGMPSGDEGVWYNDNTHYCKFGYDTETHSFTATVEPLERCGNVYMDDPGYHRCNNGVIEESCGGVYMPGFDMEDNRKWYNDITQTCDWRTGEVRNKVRCGS
jgi:hypothetical protein